MSQTGPTGGVGLKGPTGAFPSSIATLNVSGTGTFGYVSAGDVSTGSLDATSVYSTGVTSRSSGFLATAGGGYGVLNGTTFPFQVDGSGNLKCASVTCNGSMTGGTGHFSSIALNGTSLATSLATLQPRLTNIYNTNNVLTSPNALMANFVPKDQITWVTLPGTGSYIDNIATIINTWGYTENIVQRLTFAAGTGTNFDVAFVVPTAGYANQTLVIKVWVKLGSTTNWNLSINNSQTWDSVGGQTFTAAHGLTTSSYKQIAFAFTCPTTSTFTIHLGSHSNTLYGQAAQIAGTSFVYGWQIFVKGQNSTLESNLTVNGSLTAGTGSFGSVACAGTGSFGSVACTGTLTANSIIYGAGTNLATKIDSLAPIDSVISVVKVVVFEQL